MMLKHICPDCGKEHELNCTPEPDQLCRVCSPSARVTIDVDCVNTPIQKDEEIYIDQEIRKIFKRCSMNVKNVYFDR